MSWQNRYQNFSISTKLLALIVSLVLLCVLLLSYFSSSSLNKISKEQLTATEVQLKQSVLAAMQLTGENAAAKVQALLNQSFTVPVSLANILKNSAYPNQPLSRSAVKELDRSMLEANPQISSIYSQFEAQGYDNRDAEYVGNLEHSSNSGTMEIYWVREDGKLVYYPVDDPEEKHLDSVNELGIREAEWYLCGRDTLAPCALDPYLYEIEPGNEVLMTTLAAPVVVNGQFRGTVGIDINLPVIQQWISQQAKSFYNGQSRLTLVSQRELLVASSEFPQQLSQQLKNVSPELKKVLDSADHTISDDKFWHVKVPINIAQANTQWQLLVSVPVDVAMAPVAKMAKVANDTFSSERANFIYVALILLVVAIVLVVWLARSISRPIETVSGAIALLSSNEGDLTQEINVRNHKELIEVSDGLNRFMEKLRDMIISLKSEATELNSQVTELDGKALSMRHETDEQESNLDNVVAAINQMAATATEVANLASGTADSSNKSATMLTETQNSFRQNVDEVNSLATQIQSSADKVSEVAHRSQDITSIVVTIQAIAEQTNLLALNAAIEAARAGEQGRGFAVVADEVRSLAARTQSSTQEIGDLIQNLQQEVNQAVTSLGQIQTSVTSTVDKTHVSFEQLSEVLVSINDINDNAAQVATAAEEQSQVSEDINRRIVAIGDGSKQLSTLGDELKALSQVVHSVVESMNKQLGRLKS
ncbi:methyl-accepting chemotaxis protein [Neptunicella sp.]|uniref:methyl-accepting chemotaxis protein n=1 Tax=Neptunicella sp. TaxID=2125986 RepID=UPI003F691D6C